MWCEKCHSVQLAIGERCDECGHVQGEITVDKDKRIAELEAHVLNLECAIRYATYLDHDKMSVHPSHYPYVDLAEKVPLLREVHLKHSTKVGI